MEYIIIAVLFAAAAFLLTKLLIIKHEIKSVAGQLTDLTNTIITAQLADRDLENLVLGINHLISHMQELKTDEARKSESLRLFIADISHDMRTPLTSTIGYLQLAKKDCPDENVLNDINIALEIAYYCRSLINDFFEISLIDSDKCIPVIENIDVAGFICEQILASYPLFEDKNIAPVFKNADKPIYANADKNMLVRVIQNLIQNSIKYTSGGSILADFKDGRLAITINLSTSE